MRARPAGDTYGPRSPTVDPGGQLAQRALVGTGVADHHRYVIGVPPLDQAYSVMAARLAVGTPRDEDTLGPGQVLLPRRRPDDVLDTHGPERMRRMMAHRTQDHGCA